MSTLETLVKDIVNKFVNDSELFTALDVSNKVKEVMPSARHKVVRDMVRDLFVTDMEPQGYYRTPINVFLGDGSVVTAILYHHASDSWDLDKKYDDKKRAQTSAHTTTVTVSDDSVTVSTTDGGSLALVTDDSVKVTTTNGAPLNDPKTFWKKIFNSCYMFPRS